ncbi:MAG TPA: SRPBCC domain-containing protein [Polyangiaceae bacterium]|nr:SRPBCC domain-containing protein [Polyangiaceae bacterium]
MRQIETSLDIAAPADKVWDVLADLRGWDEWNPVITRMRATLSPRTPVSFVIAAGGREMKIRAEMIKVEFGRELRWRGPTNGALGLMLRGEHYLVVESAGPARSRIVHGEQFEGLLLPVIWGKLRSDLEEAYSEMNRALKARVERKSAPPSSGAARKSS